MPRSSSPQIAPPVSAGELVEQPDPMAPAGQPVAPAPDQASTADAQPGIVEGAVPAAPDEPDYPSRRTLARWLLVLLALYAVGWLLWNAWAALTPFLIGLVLAFLMLPGVNRLSRWMPRWLAILTVYAGGIVLVVVAADYIIPPVVRQVQQLIESFPSIDQIQSFSNRLLDRYHDLVPAALQPPIEQGAQNALRTLQANITTYLQTLGTFILTQVIQIFNTVTFLIGFLIIPIWLFYVLNDQQQGRAFVDRILHPRIRRDFWNVFGIVDEVLSDYVRGQLLLGLAVGVMVGVGLLSLRVFGIHVPYVLLLSIVAGLTELIPIIGPIIGAIPGVLIGFFSAEGSAQSGLAVLVVYIVVQQLENNILVPRIIGESIGIHPAILTVVLIAMGQIFGLVGVILAAPVSAIGRDLFVYTYRRLAGLSAQAARRSIAEEGPQKQAATTPGD